MSFEEWIVAGAEVGSAVGTVSAFVVSYRLLRREASRDAAREERLHRDRAAFVNAWVERDPEFDPDENLYPPRALRFVVRNDGQAPVYNVVLWVPDFYESDGRLVLSYFDAGMLVQGQEYIKLAPEQMNENFVAPSPMPIVFTDSAGNRWLRNGEGLLAEYNDNAEDVKLDRFLISWDTAAKVNRPE